MNETTEVSWRRSILYLAIVAVVGSGLFIGMIFIGITAKITHLRAEEQSAVHLGELLDTVENTISIACFAQDKALATEVTRGLYKSHAVLGVVITCNSSEFVREYRAGTSKEDLEQAARGRLTRSIKSPFDPAEIVGEVVLDPDPQAFRQRVSEETRFVGFLAGLMLFAVVVTIAVVELRLFVRPLKAMSESLHRMDAAKGQRLQTPRFFAGTEIGSLATDINALADQLVATLDDEHALRLQREQDEKKYRAIFDNAETGIFVANRQGWVESYNPALRRLLALLEAEYCFLLSGFDWQGSGADLSQLIARCVERGEMAAADFELKAERGVSRWLNILLSPIGDGNCQGIASDITQRKLAEDKARQQAVTDALTGAANRRGLEQKLTEIMRRSEAGPGRIFTLLLIDLDGFKKINDALGLPIGDRILKTAADRLRTCIKKTDFIARSGSDEFSVVLDTVVGESAASAICRRIVDKLGQSYQVHADPIDMGVSIGITFYPEDGGDMPTLLRNVELALDRAKAQGGKRFVFYDAGMAMEAARRRALESDLQLALKRDEFVLFLQPIVDLARNRLAGAEALLRWQHPERGLVPPDQFIPVAEATGMIVDIGAWVATASCRLLDIWREQGNDLYLSINVSGRQIPDGLTPARLAAECRRLGVDTSRLALEITEGVLMRDVDTAVAWLNEIRSLGFNIYLDDFGTGYSSLSYLKQFPINAIKIDKSFVRDMCGNASDQALVKAIIAMTHGLGLKVIAEGVEDQAQLTMLRELGCDRVQGYYFSRPVPLQEFPALMSRIEGMLA